VEYSEKLALALTIPFPLMMFLALEVEDVEPHKREAFSLIWPAMQALIREFFKTVPLSNGNLR
jgi:hypothetical protein